MYFYRLNNLPGIYQQKINVKTGDALTETELIWTGILPNDAAARPEGPHLYYINKVRYPFTTLSRARLSSTGRRTI